MKKSKILIVEDEPGIAESLIYILNSEGFDTLWVDTLEQARLVFSNDPDGVDSKIINFGLPDFLILDIGLPDGTGIDFCKELRGGFVDTANLPVLFLTARQEELDKVIALEVGGDDYVTKPFSGREVAARVKAILRRSQFSQASMQPDPIALTSEVKNNHIGLMLNERSQKFEIEGRELDLSRNEFFLLKLLWENSGRIYSRTQIMNQVWEVPEASMERTVDSHIKSLRKKLSGLDCIQTQRGFGYKFELKDRI
tara:strand:+ start:27 stop:788 length:762 start_codon:yes stop_codon:yes gene_type:complete